MEAAHAKGLADRLTETPLPDLSLLHITPAILSLVAEIDEFKGAWRALGRFAPERLAALRHSTLIESVGASTRLDGATLGDRDVERLLCAPQQPLLPTRDEQAIVGYARVLQRIFLRWDALSPTETCLEQLHRELLSQRPGNRRGDDRHGSIAALLAWLRSHEASRTLHPLLLIAAFTAAFSRLQPLPEANGRCARAFTVLLLLRSGYAYVPYGSLEGLIEQHREHYERALQNASAAAGCNAWLECFLQLLLLHKRRLEKRLERERSSLGELSELSARLLGVVREHGRLTIAAAVKATGGRRGTIKDHVSALCRQGRLARHGAGRGAWYSPRA